MLIHLTEISTRTKPWRCDHCGFSTGHRGSLSRHQKNGRCGVSISIPVGSSSHNYCSQYDIPIASPLRTTSVPSSYPAVMAVPTIPISPTYTEPALDPYGPPAFQHQSPTTPPLPEIEGWEAIPSMSSYLNIQQPIQPIWNVAESMRAYYCLYPSDSPRWPPTEE